MRALHVSRFIPQYIVRNPRSRHPDLRPRNQEREQNYENPRMTLRTRFEARPYTTCFCDLLHIRYLYKKIKKHTQDVGSSTPTFYWSKYSNITKVTPCETIQPVRILAAKQNSYSFGEQTAPSLPSKPQDAGSSPPTLYWHDRPTLDTAFEQFSLWCTALQTRSAVALSLVFGRLMRFLSF